jgi:Polycystin cation channel
MIEPPVMYVTRYSLGDEIFNLDTPFSGDTYTQAYELRSLNDIGPFSPDKFNHSQIERLTHITETVSISFRLRNFELHADSRTCYEWHITTNYDFGVRGRVDMSIDSSPRLCSLETDVSWIDRAETPAEVWFLLITIIAAFFSQVLYIKAIIRDIRIFLKLKRAHERRSHGRSRHVFVFDDLTWADRMKFFNVWFIAATVGNACNLLGAAIRIHSITSVTETTSTQMFFIGFGCLMAWASVVQFFETTTSYYVLITTLKNATPRVARFLVGVLPVFLGYAMFGVAFFATATTRFATVDAASVTLFALLNGDVIHDVFDELHPAHPLISRIYLYTFISLFIYAVLNIFVAIVEDAFFASKAFQEQQEREYEKLDLDDVDPLELLDAFDMPKDGPSSSDDDDDDDDDREEDDHASHYDGASHVDRVSSMRSTDDLKEPLLTTGMSSAEDSHSTAAAATADTPTISRQSSSRSKASSRNDLSSTSSLQMQRMMASFEKVQSQFSAEFQKEFASFLSTIAIGTPTLQSVTASDDDSKSTEPLQQSGIDTDAEADALAIVAAAGHDPNAWRKLVNKTTLQSLQRVSRPPHDPSYFPCGFTDCLYCTIRQVFVDALADAKDDLLQVLAAFVARAQQQRSIDIERQRSTAAAESHI